MKNERQEKILAIIAASAIETQEQLIDSLREEGISCTQATISRDIKQLHLIKEPSGNGTYRYAVSTQKMLTKQTLLLLQAHVLQLQMEQLFM